jgi:hypothetical protein
LFHAGNTHGVHPSEYLLQSGSRAPFEVDASLVVLLSIPFPPWREKIKVLTIISPAGGKLLDSLRLQRFSPLPQAGTPVFGFYSKTKALLTLLGFSPLELSLDLPIFWFPRKIPL